VSAIVIVATAVVGNVNILNRAPDSYVAEIVTKVQDTKLNLPILADDIWVFFASAIYTDEKNPVYGTLETTFTNGWGSEEPMKYFEDKLERKDSQVYETLEDFLNENKEFWYVTEKETAVYAWNDTAALKVALLDKDTRLPVLKEEGDWYIVSLRGAVGWIHK
jgi:hypothetical protein